MIEIGIDCKIHPTAQINVMAGKIDDRTVISEGVKIEGRYVQIGKESFINRNAYIGGGSFFDKNAKLITGDWFHMGPNSLIDIASGVTIGHEFGFGIDSKLVTHGTYLDTYNLGAPMQWDGTKIGNNVWLPNAWVNPGVVLGDNIIASARSHITKSFPSNSLISGSPAKVIKNNYLPKKLSNDQKRIRVNLIINQFFNRNELTNCNEYKIEFISDEDLIIFISQNKKTFFYLQKKIIKGYADNNSELLKDQLRRNGIRFRYQKIKDQWLPWI